MLHIYSLQFSAAIIVSNILFQSLAPNLQKALEFDSKFPEEENLVFCICFSLALIKRSLMLDGTVMLETSNIIDELFQHITHLGKNF